MEIHYLMMVLLFRETEAKKRMEKKRNTPNLHLIEKVM
jgi:hypothetical protein